MAFNKSKDNTGTLGRNKRKENEKQPEYTGKCLITEPGEHWISAWVRTGPDGNKFFSLAFKPKDANISQPVSKIDPADYPSTQPKTDDECPF